MCVFFVFCGLFWRFFCHYLPPLSLPTYHIFAITSLVLYIARFIQTTERSDIAFVTMLRSTDPLHGGVDKDD